MIALLALLSHVAVAGQGLDAELASPVRDAEVELRVHVTDHGVRRAVVAGEPDVLRLEVDDGGLTDVRLEPVAADGVLTIVAIDASGSFSRFLAPSFEVTERYLDDKATNERVGFLLFGVRRQDFATESDPDRIRQRLDEVRRADMKQAETRLAEFVRQAAMRASEEQPWSAGGVRQIVLFTDGGEESQAWSVDDVVSDLRDLDVRVHVVAFYEPGRGPKATALDNLARLASRTGGTYAQGSSAAEAAAGVEAITSSTAGLWTLSGRVCGLEGPTSLHVEAWMQDRRVAWSDPVATGPIGEAAAAPCPSASAAPSARSPSALLAVGCLPLGFLALIALFIAGVVWVARRRAAPVVEPEPPPPEPPQAPPAPTPVVKPAPANLLTRDDSSPEPPSAASSSGEVHVRTHLVVVRGEGHEGRRIDLGDAGCTVGALPDNDLVVDLPTISGHHARFTVGERGRVAVTDANSSNGTWVQGARLAPGKAHTVQPGDRVALSQALVLELREGGP